MARPRRSTVRTRVAPGNRRVVSSGIRRRCSSGRSVRSGVVPGPSRRRRCRRWSAGDVDELELQAVGVGEEDGVVAGRVVVLAGWIEDASAARLEFPGEGVHLAAASGTEGDLAEPDAVLVEPVGCEAGIGLLDPEAAGLTEPTCAPCVLGDARVAEPLHQPGVEPAGTCQVVHVDDDVVHAGRDASALGGWTATGIRERHEIDAARTSAGACGTVAQNSGSW